MPWISNDKHKIEEKSTKKFPVLFQSCQPQTGGPVGISNTDLLYQPCIRKVVACKDIILKIQQSLKKVSPSHLTHLPLVLHICISELSHY